jgi:integrase
MGHRQRFQSAYGDAPPNAFLAGAIQSVFALSLTKDRWRDPRGVLYRAQGGRFGMGGFHDFQHFRVSQWVMKGIDLRTVQELLGHRDITTTMRYADFPLNHATPTILDTHSAEMEELFKKPVAIGDK